MRTKSRLILFLVVLVMIFSMPLFSIGKSLQVKADYQELVQNKAICMTISNNGKSRNFAWKSFGEAKVQICKRDELKNGKFTSKAKIFYGDQIEITSRESYNHVTVEGIQEKNEYAYRLGGALGEDGFENNIYYFTTKNTKDGFNFIFVGDPQIADENDAYKYANTLDNALVKFPDTSFILDAGDTADADQTALFEYSLSPSAFLSLPVIPTQGNHDDCSLFPKYFNLPNVSDLGVTDGNESGGDYYFTYGNALFMVLNMNSAYRLTYVDNDMTYLDEHDRFIEKTMKKNKKDWNFVMFHQSIYSAGNHSNNEYTLGLREPLAKIFSKYNIDVVFQGHDHTQVRTYFMKNNKAVMEQTKDNDGIVKNPEGTLYLTGTGSANKHYSIKESYLDTINTWAAFKYSGKTTGIPCFTQVFVNKGEFSIETYTVNGNNVDLLDSFCFRKDVSKQNGCKNEFQNNNSIVIVGILFSIVIIVLKKTYKKINKEGKL